MKLSKTPSKNFTVMQIFSKSLSDFESHPRACPWPWQECSTHSPPLSQRWKLCFPRGAITAASGVYHLVILYLNTCDFSGTAYVWSDAS